MSLEGACGGITIDICAGGSSNTFSNSASVSFSVVNSVVMASVIPGGVDHNSLANLTVGDPHTQYALLAGRAGGQSLSGGTAANDDLTLQGTTNATRTTSYVNLQPNGGFVGIGTATPGYLLDISGGNLNLPTTSSSSVGVLLQNGGRLLHTYGSQNLFLGGSVGNFTLTGNNNFGMGNNTLSALTGGSGNIAIGPAAGRDMQSGVNNLIAGTNAMITATTATNTVALGYQAGFGMNGNDGVIIGYNALSASGISSNKIVSIGRDSGRSQTTGDSDVYIGYNAGPTVNGLSNAIAIGANAGVSASNTGVLGASGTNAVVFGVCAGQSTAYAKIGGVIFNHFVDAGNSTTTETDLYSDTIPAATLSANGCSLQAEYGGVFVSSATATRQVKIYFGGTVIFDTGALTLSLSSAWTVYSSIIRVSSSVVRYMISLTTEGAALSAYTAVGELTGLTLANTNILKITGQAAGVGAATNDIVAQLGNVSWQPAA